MPRGKTQKLGEYAFYTMLEDDPSFEMKKGDVFIGAPYEMDPQEKVSVGFRISDGFDPWCNQYWSSVRPLTEEETERVVWSNLRKIDNP